MPFQAYFVTLAGTTLLVWATLRAHARRAQVGITICAMIGALVLAGVAAQLTGIAQSTDPLEPWRYALTAGLGVISLVAQVALVVEGSLLIRDLFAGHEQAPPLTPAHGAWSEGD